MPLLKKTHLGSFLVQTNPQFSIFLDYGLGPNLRISTEDGAKWLGRSLVYWYRQQHATEDPGCRGHLQ